MPQLILLQFRTDLLNIIQNKLFFFIKNTFKTIIEILSTCLFTKMQAYKNDGCSHNCLNNKSSCFPF